MFLIAIILSFAGIGALVWLGAMMVNREMGLGDREDRPIIPGINEPDDDNHDHGLH